MTPQTPYVPGPTEQPFTLQQMATPNAARRRRWLPFAVTALVLALAGGGYAAYALTHPGPSEPASGSIAACQDAVRKQLRSPSTAKFSEDRVVEEAGATHYVHGVVDAQNGFGAMLRNRYECIANQSADRWSIADVSLLAWP